ncbi:endo-1,4-beta-xylanase [Modestobacter sp. VKM Ac-2986]|uniref:endo-1,4-beta-xylanase n=1 Tax=Modestobacter sp. VKM Ac-2986 TaxID=3004140 RepID=UPI0022AABC29|nr:endo-1,4-beta-xylanase [Modestobacter sp. VKM Ac-2986]MCZ2829192.1 endo-1,4-beta-xylanase [Modestobacter sp. VKM Ac-2986]
MAGGVGLLAAPAASAAPATVYETGFESGTASWVGRGDAKVAVTTEQARTGAQSLLATGRTAAWHGPALNAAAFMPAGTYEVEAWVRLKAGTGSDPAATTDQITVSSVRTTTGGTTTYDTVGGYQIPVSDSTWTKVGGQYTFGTANSGLELYLESPDVTQQFYVDDVRIVGEAAAPVAPGTAAPLSTDFESGLQGWAARGAAQVAVTPGAGRNGTAGLTVTNRLQNWQGPAIDVTKNVAIGQAVAVSVWAKLAPGQAPASLQLSVQRDKGTVTNYEGVGGAAAVVTADAWTELKGTYVLGAPIDKAQLYVEGTANASFAIDDLRMTPVVEEPIQDVPALKDVLGAQGFEHVSTAIDSRETVGRPAKLLTKHFNTFTPENDGKPAEIQPTEGVFTFGDLDALLDFADANDVQVYGHVLAWHSQTPDWFFKDGSRDLTNSAADQALLRSRMEAHIKAIADHVNARYPDGDSPIWAWDVVNEVIDDADNANVHDMRNSRWFQVLGETFVDDAFGFANEYFPDAKLFINDYNTEMPTKRVDYLELIAALKQRGVPIDGVGHQAHVDFSRPIEWLDASMDAVEALDPTLLQAITELDVSTSAENNGADVSAGTVPQHRPGMADQTEAELENGYYYRDLFAMLRTHEESVESVTFWGISNARSWLRTWPAARPWEAPLPFGDQLEAKPAYWGIVDPTKLAPRPSDQLAPRIAGHDTVRATSTGVDGARVTYTLPEAGDTRDGAITPVCTPPSGSLFPIGTTKVTCTATDEAGNKANPVTFDVVVTPPPTTTALYSQINNGSVVRANVKQNVQVVVQFGNKGTGKLVGSTFAYSCTQTSGPAMTLELAPGSAQQVTNRDYPAGQNANFQLRGTPTQVGTATFDCTLTMTDAFGAEVTSTNTVTIDVRK